MAQQTPLLLVLLLLTRQQAQRVLPTQLLPARSRVQQHCQAVQQLLCLLEALLCEAQREQPQLQRPAAGVCS